MVVLNNLFFNRCTVTFTLYIMKVRRGLSLDKNCYQPTTTTTTSFIIYSKYFSVSDLLKSPGWFRLTSKYRPNLEEFTIILDDWRQSSNNRKIIDWTIDVTQQQLWYCRATADCRFETLNDLRGRNWMIMVKTHRKPRRSKFHLFSTQVSHIGIRIYSENIVCCVLWNLLQSSIKYILSLLKLWNYFEKIIKYSLNSAFVWYA